MGRTKLDSVELDKPADSHVASTDQDVFGHIFRRNMTHAHRPRHDVRRLRLGAAPAPGDVESMAGTGGGTRDAITRFTHPVTGAYYFVPSIESLLDVSS